MRIDQEFPRFSLRKHFIISMLACPSIPALIRIYANVLVMSPIGFDIINERYHKEKCNSSYLQITDIIKINIFVH